MFEYIRADMQRYRAMGGWHTSAGFWVSVTYRFGHWAVGIGNPVVRWLLCLVHAVISVPWWFVKGVDIPKRAAIGPGLALPHPQNILISPDAKFGARCTIYQEVTVGHGPLEGVPEIGNEVALFAGAKVLGGIRIGDDVEVGANAVVLRDVESHSIVSAPASRAIPRETITQLREARRPQAAPEVGDTVAAGARGPH